MSGLAQALLARGARVSGSDIQRNAATERLAAQGATIYDTQGTENLERERPDLVVVTAAIPEDNPELVAAYAAGIEVVSRAEFLGRLMAGYSGPRIAVTGTHGKTTTTAMLACALVEAGLDPTLLLGGEYAPLGGNARIGRSEVFLTEACEAYDSFLALRPDVAVITNIEADHLDYYMLEARLFASFRRFIGQTASNGLLVWCAEDEGTQRLVAELPEDAGPRRRIAYGLEPHGPNSIRAAAVVREGMRTRFVVSRTAEDGSEESLGAVRLCVPGQHNVLNALAAIATGLALNVPFSTIAAALEGFGGTERRFEVLAEAGGVTLLDDYAHHPTEIRATITTAREVYPERRLVVVFQPHLYSRTRDFLDEFADTLAEADVIVLTDIYPAREQPIPGVRVADIVHRAAAQAPAKTVLYLPDKRDVLGALVWLVRTGDVVMTMGAGDIREVGEAYAARLQRT